MRIERTPNPGGASYSDVVAVDVGDARFLHVAGQTPRPDAAGEIPADLAGQTERCLHQIVELLRPQGATLADVVSITTYLIRLDDYADFAAVRARMFGDTLPASAAVAVAALLGDVLVEIQAVAVVAAKPAGAPAA